MLSLGTKVAEIALSLLILSSGILAQSSCPTCQNGGTCGEVPNSPGQHLCICPSSWTGLDCSQAAIASSNSSIQQSSSESDSCGGCLNAATCQQVYNSPGSYYCQCATGYSGSLCQTAPPAAAPTAQSDSCGGCRNGGSCQQVYNSPGSYYCQCKGGDEGSLCELAPPAPSPVRSSGVTCGSSGSYTCQNGGTCSAVFNSPGEYQCTCPARWRGLDCSSRSSPASAPSPTPAKSQNAPRQTTRSSQSASGGFPRENLTDCFFSN